MLCRGVPFFELIHALFGAYAGVIGIPPFRPINFHFGGRGRDFSNECWQVEYGERLACEGKSKSQKNIGVDR